MDEALQRLYWACRTHGDFPGRIPDESTGVVTTHAILKALDLAPTMEDPDRPHGLKQEPSSSRKDSLNDSQRPVTLRSDDADTSGSQTPFTSPSSFYAHESAYVTTPVPLPVPSMLSEAELHDSYTKRLVPVRHPPTAPPGRRPSAPGQIRSNSTLEFVTGLSNVELPLDVNAFLDESACTFPAETDLTPGRHEVVPDLLPMDQTAQMSCLREMPSLPEPGSDHYLHAWPGSLASAYQFRPTA